MRQQMVTSQWPPHVDTQNSTTHKLGPQPVFYAPLGGLCMHLQYTSNKVCSPCKYRSETCTVTACNLYVAHCNGAERHTTTKHFGESLRASAQPAPLRQGGIGRPPRRTKECKTPRLSNLMVPRGPWKKQPKEHPIQNQIPEKTQHDV